MYAQCRTNGPPTFKHGSRILRGITLLSLLAVLGLMNTPTAVAAEPAIYIPTGYPSSPYFSLALRNDGVLFQFGGQQFTPKTLDGSVATPMQTNAVILTGIDSLPMDDNKGGSQQEGAIQVFAITSTSEVNTWQPNGTLNTQPVVIETSPGNPLTGIKEVVTGGPTTLIVTQSGTVFSFGGNQTTQLTDLSDVKTIKTDYQAYLALTNSGNVLFGQWDYKSAQYLPPVTIQDASNVDISNVAILNMPTDFKYSALTNTGKIYIWGFDWINNVPTPATKVKNTSDIVLSGVVQMFVNNIGGIALTGNDEIYTWEWNSDANYNLISDPATLVGGVSNITALYQEKNGYLAVTNTGDVYELTNPATQITGISGVKDIYTPLDGGNTIAVTIGGDVYALGSTTTTTPISGLSNIAHIEMYGYNGDFFALTKTGEVYEWNNTNSTTTRLAGLSNISAIKVSGNSYSLYLLAMKADGILCGWGDNSSGQLGIDPITTPEPIITTPVCDIEDLIVNTSASGQNTLTVNVIGNGVVLDGAINACYSSCSTDYIDGNMAHLTALPEPGFMFTSWSGDCTDTSNIAMVIMDAPKTCTATFDAAPNRTLTMTKAGTGSGTVTATTGEGNGLNCGTDCTEDYLHGNWVNLTATPAADSKFIGWTGTNCANGFAITADMNCTATFDLLPTYTLDVTINNMGTGAGSVTSQPTGISCNGDCTEDYVEGTDVTLTATPDANSTFFGWSGDCSGNSQTTVNMTQNTSCTVTFGPNGTPAIQVYPQSMEFTTKMGESATRTVTILNSSQNGGLILGTIDLNGANTFVLNDACSNIGLAPGGKCEITVQYQPQSEATQTATLSIPSNDPATPTMTIPLEGSGCSSGSYQRYVDVYPRNLDFGTEALGNTTSLELNAHSWSYGCGSIEVDTIDFTGTNASEFSFKNKHCYYGGYDNSNYSSCQFTVDFKPTSAGTKNANATLIFNDTNVSVAPVSINANAVVSGTPNIAVSPNSHDFGSVVLGRGSSDYQAFTVQNTGNVNLQIDRVEITGTDANEFHAYHWDCSYNSLLPPGDTCEVNARFVPTLSIGSKQANLSIVSNAPTTNIALTGTVTEPADCSDSNITIESVSDGIWDVAGTWNLGRMPSETDVVRINSGHTITGLPFATVKALCIQQGGTLASLDDQGTPLEIQATDYIENQGIILGQDGADESSTCTTQTDIGTGLCAMPGASIILKVGSAIKQYGKAGDQWWYSYASGGPILNTGQILAGNGGNGSQYGAPGGDAIVLGRNTVNRYLIKAGDGGSLSGTGSGEAGKGGVTQIWGKLGGSGHLYNQYGAQALAGHGGHCNSSTQTGGDGGNLWLVSLPDVYLSGGIHKAGNKGNGCTNGEDGWVRIEPLLIDLSDANTEVSGGNVSIYGGNDWTLNLSDINNIVINATGDVILAVGTGGVIDLSGNTSPIIKATGTVYLFSDKPILLDNGMMLETLIDAGEIVRGPSKLLREVSLTSSDQAMIEEPNTSTTINLTIGNNGPEADTYDLSMSNSKGWTLSQLPATIQVDALSAVDLPLDITFSETPGELNVITVTATSQNDAEVSATATIQVAVAGGTLANATTGATTHSSTSLLPNQMSLFVEIYGTGSGQVTSDQGNINCQPANCQAIDFERDASTVACDPNYCQTIVNTAETVLLTASPDAGSIFRGWGGHKDCGDGELLMDGNKLCIAFFAKLQQLTVNTEGHGTVEFYKPHKLGCSNDKCVAQFGYGTRTHIKAVPETGYRFLGWSGDCAGMNRNLKLNIQTNQTCTALFE